MKMVVRVEFACIRLQIHSKMNIKEILLFNFQTEKSGYGKCLRTKIIITQNQWFKTQDS